MRSRAVIRAVKLAARRKTVLLRLYRVADDGSETLEATSAPVTMVAAAAICKLFQEPSSIRPDIESLKRVFQVYGHTAWAGFVARDAFTAVQQASLQHDVRRAKGVLIIITLAMDFNIVDTVDRVMNALHRPAPAGLESALLVTYDEALEGEVKVELLWLGV
ncbi:MAG: hypothetical protein GX772_03310 [Alcaligenaceae bacterium]|nr:hypothetical protein [Alcaligenaceae bacterium]